MSLKYLIGYNAWHEKIIDRYEAYFSLLRKHGYKVDGFCLSIPPGSGRFSFDQLQWKWDFADYKLMRKLISLENLLKNYDVLINLHGANLPPQFVKQLGVYTVFRCNDDPESSADLSRPAAWAYDQAFVGNIAEVDAYRDWGVKKTEFLPLGFLPQDVHPKILEGNLNLDKRDIDLIFFGERESPWRRNRLERLVKEFPNAIFGGRGWPKGCIPKQEMLEIYSRAKIGINLHRSTGPINQRLYQLPANGVMQICDNKDNLGKILKLGEEVVGFDTIGEAIEQIKYYLKNDKERINIAYAGYQRVNRDYNYLKTWKHLVKSIEKNFNSSAKKQINFSNITRTHWKKTIISRLWNTNYLKTKMKGLCIHFKGKEIKALLIKLNNIICKSKQKDLWANFQSPR